MHTSNTSVFFHSFGFGFCSLELIAQSNSENGNECICQVQWFLIACLRKMQQQAPTYIPHALARTRNGEMVLALSLIDAKHSFSKSKACSSSIQRPTERKELYHISISFGRTQALLQETTMISNASGIFLRRSIRFLLCLDSNGFSLVVLCIRTIYY